MGQSLWKPCSAILGPPMPWICASGSSGRIPDSNRLASKSPEDSPATMAIESLSDDATSGRIEEFAHLAQATGGLRRGGLGYSNRCFRLLQSVTGLVDQFVGVAEC